MRDRNLIAQMTLRGSGLASVIWALVSLGNHIHDRSHEQHPQSAGVLASVIIYILVLALYWTFFVVRHSQLGRGFWILTIVICLIEGLSEVFASGPVYVAQGIITLIFGLTTALLLRVARQPQNEASQPVRESRDDQRGTVR